MPEASRRRSPRPPARMRSARSWPARWPPSSARASACWSRPRRSANQIGEPIPVYCRYNPVTGDYKDLLELSARDLAGDYGVEVIFPQKRGSNLPLAQAMFQWWKGEGLSHFTWLQDGWGEENPNEEIDRIMVEKALMSEKGQELIWQLAGRIQGDREMAKIAGLMQSGQAGPGRHAKLAHPAAAAGRLALERRNAAGRHAGHGSWQPCLGCPGRHHARHNANRTAGGGDGRHRSGSPHARRRGASHGDAGMSDYVVAGLIGGLVGIGPGHRRASWRGSRRTGVATG